MKTLMFTLPIIMLLSSVTTWALTTKDKQHAAHESILAELETHYSMEPHKIKVYGISLAGLRSKYSDLIDRALTMEEHLGLNPKVSREILSADEFRQLMIAMIAELRDGHVNIGKPDNELTGLGLNTVEIGERLFVTELRKDLLLDNATSLPIEVGDEILEINGEPVIDVARRNLIYAAGGTFQDRWQTAMAMVVVNPHSLMRAKSEGEKATLKLRKGDKTYVAHLRWINTSELQMLTKLYPLNYPDRRKSATEDVPIAYGARGTVRSYFKNGLLADSELRQQIIPIGKILNSDIAAAQKASALAKSEGTGSGRGPSADVNAELAKLSTVHRIDVYLVRHETKMVGVMRLPSYSPGGMSEIKKEFLWITEALKRLEKLSDVLVIDQLSNTGGSVYYVTRLLSLFANKETPIKTMLSNAKLNETYLNAIKPSYYEEPVTGKPPQYVGRRLEEKLYHSLKEKFERGEHWSGLIPDMALPSQLGDENAHGEIFAAHEGVYTHPIVLANDKMSGSGGDFFPAILQQNGRATIFGETSCGLGGSLYRNTPTLPGSEMSFRCTSAYFEKPDGWPLEGIGTVPNVVREISESDLKDGFKAFAKELLNLAVQKVQANGTTSSKLVRHGDALNSLAAALKGLTGESYISDSRALLDLLPSASEAELKKLLIPLPTDLLRDIVLRTLWHRIDVENRLVEMKNLPAFQAHIDLIDAVLALTRATHADTLFAEPCEVHLLMTPLK